MRRLTRVVVPESEMRERAISPSGVSSSVAGRIGRGWVGGGWTGWREGRMRGFGGNGGIGDGLDRLVQNWLEGENDHGSQPQASVVL